jgi:hypothetical protein
MPSGGGIHPIKTVQRNGLQRSTRVFFPALTSLPQIAGHRRCDRGANRFDSAPHWIDVQVGVALRRGRLAMAE